MTKNTSSVVGGALFLLGMLCVGATWFVPSDMGVDTVVSLAATGLFMAIIGAMLSVNSVVMDESENIIKRLPAEETIKADADSSPA